MSTSPPIELPNTTPGGMSAHVHYSPVPYVDDRVVIGPLTMPMREFCMLVEHVMTCSPLKDTDPRAWMLSRLSGNVLYIRPDGTRTVVLDGAPYPSEVNPSRNTRTAPTAGAAP